MHAACKVTGLRLVVAGCRPAVRLDTGGLGLHDMAHESLRHRGSDWTHSRSPMTRSRRMSLTMSSTCHSKPWTLHLRNMNSANAQPDGSGCAARQGWKHAAMHSLGTVASVCAAELCAATDMCLSSLGTGRQACDREQLETNSTWQWREMGAHSRLCGCCCRGRSRTWCSSRTRTSDCWDLWTRKQVVT